MKPEGELEHKRKIAEIQRKSAKKKTKSFVDKI